MKRLFIAVTAFACFTAACNTNRSPATGADTAATMNSTKNDMAEKNKETALACIQGVNNHSADEALKDAAPDIVDYAAGDMPPAKGLDSCKAGLKMFLSVFPDIKGENFMAIAEGNHVAVFGDWSGTFKGEIMGMKPTGKSFKVKDVDLFTFNDEGKITEHHSFQTMQTLMTQVGAKMK